MKPLTCLGNFMEKVALDNRLLPSHVSLFTAIVHCIESKDDKGFLKVNRRRLMYFSKIKSVATYHKCMAELVAYDFIIYYPSFDPYRASRVLIKISAH
jgi:hypothetical protein